MLRSVTHLQSPLHVELSAKMGGMSSNPENQIDANRLVREAAEGNQQASQEPGVWTLAPAAKVIWS